MRNIQAMIDSVNELHIENTKYINAFIEIFENDIDSFKLEVSKRLSRILITKLNLLIKDSEFWRIEAIKNLTNDNTLNYVLHDSNIKYMHDIQGSTDGIVERTLNSLRIFNDVIKVTNELKGDE